MASKRPKKRTVWLVRSDRDDEIVVRCDTEKKAEAEAERLGGEQRDYRAQNPINAAAMREQGMEPVPPTTYRVERLDIEEAG